MHRTQGDQQIFFSSIKDIITTILIKGIKNEGTKSSYHGKMKYTAHIIVDALLNFLKISLCKDRVVN